MNGGERDQSVSRCPPRVRSTSGSRRFAAAQRTDLDGQQQTSRPLPSA